jgi:hypothetical protein
MMQAIPACRCVMVCILPPGEVQEALYRRKAGMHADLMIASSRGASEERKLGAPSSRRFPHIPSALAQPETG